MQSHFLRCSLEVMEATTFKWQMTQQILFCLYLTEEICPDCSNVTLWSVRKQTDHPTLSPNTQISSKFIQKF
jgi:hypothetical protein